MRRVQRARPVLTVLLFLIATSPAFADGAMSLALATFAWGPWFAYVVTTILFEAAALGRWLRVPWKQAFATSLKANAVTAVLGGLVSGIICAFIPGFYGGQLNPNPFGRTLLLFTLFGCVSALIEAMLWKGAVVPASTPVTDVAARSPRFSVRDEWSWQVWQFISSACRSRWWCC
jgi:hypothetical protein